MTVQDLILQNINQQLSRIAMYRGLLDHTDWRGGGAGGFVWISSTQDGADRIAGSVREDLIGTAMAIPNLDDHLAAIEPGAWLMKIDPSGPLSLVIDASELAAIQRFARGYRIERAMAASDYPRVRAYDHYLVPYFGVLGEGHQVIALPTAHGSMVAAFTTGDAVERFLATGDDENRANVKLVAVDGEVLFGEAGPQMAHGVIVNIAGPRAFGFDLDACRLVAGV